MVKNSDSSKPRKRDARPDSIPPIRVPPEEGGVSGLPPSLLGALRESRRPPAPPDSEDADASLTDLQPRIIRDGLLDAMVDWVRDHVANLRSGRAPRRMLEEVESHLEAIESLRDNLACLERSIELVGRENAKALIEQAGVLRARIVTLYEELVSEA